MEKDTPISLEGLSKFYGPVRGIEDVSFEVAAGEIFGFLGPNGAGKTTGIRLLLGMLKPDRGTIRLFGRSLREDSWRFKARIGNLPGDIDWWPDLTGQEILDFFARFRPERPPVLQCPLAGRLKMDEGALARKVKTYSRGMRRKLGLIVAMQHDPDLLILDEPTSGLDPLMRRAFFDHCRNLKERGKTVFFSSHNLFETQSLCDRVGIIRDGRLAALETMESLKAKSIRKVEITFRNAGDLDRFRLEGAEGEIHSDRKAAFRYQGPPSPLIDALSGIPVEDLTITPPSLEDLFLHYLGLESGGSEVGGGP